MAVGDGVIFNSYRLELLGGTGIDLEAGPPINVALMAAGFSPNIDTQSLWSQISANEISGTGYTAGGAALSGKVLTQDNVNDRIVFDAADVTWTGLNVGTPSYAVLYETTGGMLIGAWEIGVASNGNDYTLRFNVNGVLTLS